MKQQVGHRFKVSPGRAARIQDELRARLSNDKPLDAGGVRFVAGVDVSYLTGGERMFATAVVFRYPEMEPVESRWGSATVEFPYIPGLLAFREAPAVLPVLGRLTVEPDVLLVDGHGVAHPRGFGIASHPGVLLGVPAVGVAKSVLVGEYRMPARRRGSRAPLIHRGRTVGCARARGRRGPITEVGYHIVGAREAPLTVSVERMRDRRGVWAGKSTR